MSAAAVQIVAPSDAQLAYLADLCEARGLVPPAAIHSRTEASECIAAILRREYDPAQFEPGAPVPFR
jgi:hypothetical protein